MSDLNKEMVAADLRDVGKKDELVFWNQIVTSDRFIENFCKLSPNPEMNIEVDLFLQGLACEKNKAGRSLNILDIGSGPVSMLSRSFVGKDVQLLAADPLGDDYKKIWSNPYPAELVTPVACDGEKLSEMFGESRFDVTHIRNALDHVIHPVAVLEEMIKVTFNGGYLIVHGFENEAELSAWTGYHQWNLAYEVNDMIIRGKNTSSYFVADYFRGRMRVVRSWKGLLADRPWFGIIMQVTS